MGNHRLAIANYPGEKVVIGGGEKVLVSAQRQSDGTVKIDLPNAGYLRQLYVNQSKAVRSREPDGNAFYTISAWNQPNQTLQVNQQNWQQAGATEQLSQSNPLEMVIARSYNQNRLRVAAATASNSGHLEITPSQPERSLAFTTGPRRSAQAYYLENSLAFVDQPGEYFYDRDNSELTYFPKAGDTGNQFELIVPKTETLLAFDGAQGVTVSGLTFAYTAWDRPSKKGFLQRQGGLFYSQAQIFDSQNKLIWQAVPAAISLKNSSELLFFRNVIEHVGGNGVNYAAATRNNALVGNVFNQIADTAVLVGVEQEPYPAAGNENKDELITNNFFHKMGSEYSGSAAIFATFPNHLVVMNNEIDGSDNLGINLGWHNYEQDDTALRNGWIYRNKIQNIGAGHDDSGAIHTKNNQPNTRIEENHIVNASKRANYPTGLNGGSNGIYLDNYTKDLLLKKNQVDNSDTAIHLNTNDYFNILLQNQLDDQLVRDNAGLTAEFSDIKQALSGGLIAAAVPQANAYQIPAIQSNRPDIYTGETDLTIDFESDPLNSNPASISYFIAKDAGTLNIEAKDGSNVLKFVDNYRQSMKRVQYIAQPTRLTEGSYAIEYRFNASQTKAALYLALQQGNQVLGKTGLSPRRSIRIWDQNKRRWHHRYQANRWHHMRVEVNLDQQNYRFLLDGQASPWYRFKSELSQLEAVVLYSEWGSGTYYLDDFKISKIN